MTPVIAPRPTLYKGIRMRSRLEASFAQVLDAQGAKWEYEPVCFASPAGQWLPDFSMGDDLFIEIKPPSFADSARHVNDLLTRMEGARASKPTCGLVMVFWTWGARNGPSIVIDQNGCRWWNEQLAYDGRWRLWPSRENGSDVALEQRILGAMMLTGVVPQSIDGNDFARSAHELLFLAAWVTASWGKRVDAISVATALERTDNLQRCGGARYIHKILESIQLPLDMTEMDSYCEKLRNLRLLRKVPFEKAAA